jgi:long-subunit fatty acid transport protein
VLCLCCAATAAQAGGYAVTTFGSSRTGMLANVASVDEATAVFHNPAALADQKGWRLHLSSSVSFVGTEFRLQALDAERFPEISCEAGANDCAWPVGEDGFYERPIRPLSTVGLLPYVGVSRDLGIISESLRDVVISVAVTAPNAFGMELPDDSPTSYSFIKGYFVVLSSIVGLGWRLNEHFAIGGNIMYNYMRTRYSRRFSMTDILRGRDNSGNPALASTAQQMIGDVRMDFEGVDHGVGWTLSALYSPTRWLTFGFSYNDSSDARLKGDVEIEPVSGDVTQETLNSLVGMLGYRLPSGLIVEQAIPPFVTAGFNLHFSRYFEVGFDARLWFYNIYERQVIEPVYSTQEGTAPMTKEQLSQEKDYSISYDLSLGVLVRPIPQLPQLQVMAGGGFDKSPIPDEYFTIENPSMDNWRVACGVRWHPDRGIRVALTYMYIGYLDREVTTSKTSPPLNGTGVGSNQFPRLELEYVF